MRIHDYLIIGAGPGGIQLGYCLQKNGREYLILEAAEKPGSFFERFPRHRKLLSINKVHSMRDDPDVNLRWDWNSLLNEEGLRLKDETKEYWPSADDLLRYLGRFARYFNLAIQYETQVISVAQHNGVFEVVDQKGRRYAGHRLIVASGLSQPYIPEIPGIEHCENYADVSIDPQDFAGQRVLFIGKGNSAFESAEHLIGVTKLIHLVSPSPIRLAWRTHHIGHLRSVNMTLADSYLLKSQNIFLDATVKRIEPNGDGLSVTFIYSHAHGEVECLEYDRVITCTGFQFDDSMFDQSCKPELAIADRFPAQTSQWESSNVPHMYFAGALMQMRDFKKQQSAFIHGFRYNTVWLAQLFEHKYHAQEWAYQRIEPSAEKVVAAILGRMNRSSALWQQPSFLIDLLVVEGEEARYYEELPLDYVQDSSFSRYEQYYIVALEFGQDHIDATPDPFAVNRVHKDDSAQSELSTVIHPIVRRFRHGKLIRTHHVIEDIMSEWKEDVHIDPLCRFFKEEFGKGTHVSPEEREVYTGVSTFPP